MKAGRLRLFVGFALASLAIPGCHRAYYRQQADDNAYCLIEEKTAPHWPLERPWIDIDPRSRMFDPFDPDRPPMPPDDPTSHELMHCIDNKKGYPHWHINGDTPTVESPDWQQYLPTDENGVVHLTSRTAYQLALLHSRSYQQQFETLYLSALDVSAERFRFDTQFFGGYSAFYTASGQLRAPRSQLELDTYTNQTGRIGLPAGGVSAPTSGNLLMRKSFVTGADMVIGFANSLVWNYNGTNSYSTFSLLDFNLIQPLLRAAGRDRILEQLTIAERALLANVRQMERYRRAYYVEILTGTDAGNGASRRGGVFGGSGLEGFTGVGGGGFGGVGGFGAAATGGGFGGGGAGAGAVGGYLGLLQTKQDIRNQQTTIAGLRSNLYQLRESLRESLSRIPDDPETIVRERLQIAQARQALLNAESRLLNSQALYQAALDDFKRNLGLPPYLCVFVQDPMVESFNLLAPDLQELQTSIVAVQEQVAVINDQLTEAVDRSNPENAVVHIDANVRNQLSALVRQVDTLREIIAALRGEELSQARMDIQKLGSVLQSRREQLTRLKLKYAAGAAQFEDYGKLDPCQVRLLADIDPAVFDTERLASAPTILEEEAARVEQQLASYQEPLDKLEQYLRDLQSRGGDVSFAELEQTVIFEVPSLLSDVADDALDLSLVQARARADSVELTPIELQWDKALEIASELRRDWMNRRAALVDSWRLIEFNADNLESNLDLVFNGNVQNVGDNPFDFRTTNGQVRVGLRFDAPLTRLQERNTYRQALIEYQQARRSYYAYVDGVAQGIRATLRQIDLNQVNFEERRIALLSAIDQVVLNDQIQKLREELGQEAGVTAARDVVSALSDLQSAQNDFLSVYLNYEVQRMTLDLGLGTMALDADGHWIDPGPVLPGTNPADSAELSPVVPVDDGGTPPPPPVQQAPEPQGPAQAHRIPFAPLPGFEMQPSIVVPAAFQAEEMRHWGFERLPQVPRRLPAPGPREATRSASAVGTTKLP